MGNADELVSAINQKVMQLVEIRKNLIIENEKLQTKQKELKHELENQNNKIKELEEKINRIKIAKSLGDREGTGEAKLIINELLREIDKCLGLLNQ